MSVKLFNTKDFYILHVDVGDFDLNKFDWNDPNYTQILISQPFLSVHKVSNETFFSTLKDVLKIDDSHLLVTQIIGEGYGYNYELIYIDSTYKDNKFEINHFATLLNSNGEIVKGPAFVVKNHISTLTNEMYFEDMTTSELYKLLHERSHHKIVIWNDETEKFTEDEVYGPIDNYAKIFFENEPYSKSEIAFLKHNLNILYLKSEYGKTNVIGSLLNCKVEKVLIFTMNTNELYGNLTNDELQKIIKLSQILPPPFKPMNKWFEDEKDEFGRNIIKNKYRILDNVYLENNKI